MKRYKYSVLAGMALAVGLLVSPCAPQAAEVEEAAVAAVQSADNSLRQLSISGADLSPDFYYSTVKYTAAVPYEVTEVEVTAKTSNANASIKSISGCENLSVGENTVLIVVSAENGNEATYTVTVTRLAEESAESVPEEDAAATSSAVTDASDDGAVSDDADSAEDPSDAAETDGAKTDADDTAEETDETDSDTAEIAEPKEEMTDDAAAKETTSAAALSSAQITSSDEYTQLLANYNAAVAAKKQSEQKMRLMTAVFLFVIAILLIILFSVLWSKRSSEIDEEEVFDDEEKPIKKERPLETISVNRTFDAHNKKEVRIAEEEPEVEEEAEQEPEEEPEELGQEEKRESSPKKKKRRDSILAYLGLDDDLPLDYGEVLDEDEDVETPAAADSPKAPKAAHAPEKEKTSGADGDADSAEDIEFIDL